MRQGHPHERLARLDERHEGGEVGLRAGMGLHVGVIRPEQLLEPVDGELLDLVDHLAPAIIPPAGIPFGVLVRERCAHRVDDRTAGEILARDQLEAVLLAPELAIDETRHSRIGLAQWGVVIETHPCSWSILATRRLCRPPAKSVSSHVRRIATPLSSLTNRAGSTSTLASLCSRARRAISGDHASAARTPGWRLAAYDMPSPVPQRRTPRRASFRSTRPATACAKSG